MRSIRGFFGTKKVFHPSGKKWVAERNSIHSPLMTCQMIWQEYHPSFFFGSEGVFPVLLRIPLTQDTSSHLLTSLVCSWSFLAFLRSPLLHQYLYSMERRGMSITEWFEKPNERHDTDSIKSGESVTSSSSHLKKERRTNGFMHNTLVSHQAKQPTTWTRTREEMNRIAWNRALRVIYFDQTTD
jgi:hypothetical protein